VYCNQNDSGIRIAAQQEKNIPVSAPPPVVPPTGPHPQIEMGPSEDTLAVDRGQVEDTFDPPVWRYPAKDALRSPAVPAVAQAYSYAP